MTHGVHVNAIKYIFKNILQITSNNLSCPYFISYKFPKCTRNFLSFSANSETDRQTAVKTVPHPKVAGVNMQLAAVSCHVDCLYVEIDVFLIISTLDRAFSRLHFHFLIDCLRIRQNTRNTSRITFQTSSALLCSMIR